MLSPTGTGANINARRPLGASPFLDLIQFQSVVRSWHNALQGRLEKRFSQGFTVLAAYTLGKTIDYTSWHDSSGEWADPRRPELNKGLADFDRRHVTAVSFLWDLPFFNKSGRILATVLGGWQVNGIATFYAGQPFNVTSGRDNNLDGLTSNDRPNVVGEWAKAKPSGNEIKAGVTWFNTLAFTANGVGQIGSLGRNVIIGPGSNNVDLGLSKNFKLTERHSIIARIEAFNVFNVVNFANPDGQLSSGNFGKITNAGPARILQVAVKYNF